MATALALFAIFLPTSLSFSAVGPMGLRMTTSESLDKIRVSSRRDCLRTLGGVTLGISAPILFGLPTKTYAEKDVADGGLPGGALEFNRLLLSEQQWADIGKRVITGHAEMDDKEWQNVQGFLRKVYAAGDDMTTLANGFDKDSQNKVSEIVKSFRKAVKAADKPAGKKDWEAFLTSHKEVAGYFQSFLAIRSEKASLRNDIPDEI